MKIYNPFNERNYLKALSVLCIFSIILCLIFFRNLILDEFEHLRAGYLVSMGYTPYTDFFEHHHPLLWWLWAPVIKYLPHQQIFILFLARFITFIISCGTAFYIYKIGKDFFGGSKTAVITLIIYFSFYFVQYMSVIFKPDAYMWFFYIGGIYYLFRYIAQKQRRDLYLATTAFAISFIFLQTVLFLMLPVFLLTGLLLIKKQISFKECLWSSLPPLLLLAIFLSVIHLTSGLEAYYQRAWIFNGSFMQLLHIDIDNFLPKFIVFIFIGYASYGYLLKTRQATIYTHFFALLLTVDFIRNLIYPMPYPRYFQASALAIAFLTAPTIPQMKRIGKNYFIALICIFNILNSIISVYIYPNTAVLKQLNRLEHDRSSLSLFSEILDIYTPHVSFYWYSFVLAAVDNYLFRPQDSLDINRYLVENKIDYVFYNTDAWLKKAPKPNQNADKQFKEIYKKHILDAETLQQYYELLDSTPNYIYKRRLFP